MSMQLPDKLSSRWSLFFISLIGATFIVYQNIIIYSWDSYFFTKNYDQPYIIYFIFRYIYFFVFIWIILSLQLKKIVTPLLWKRFLFSFIISTIAFGIYVSITFISGYKSDFIGKILIFQFLVICILSAFTGHVLYLTGEKQKKELEIEQLKTENLESRYVALTNQINPHFFFNSLNGLSSLIRKKNEDNAIEYVNKLSDVFRYVLQSDKKSIVTLGEELECVAALFYMMEVRFANKLVFHIQVDDEHKNLRIPVLSLLPIIDNVVVHNIIDSEHKMEVFICLNEDMELTVSNPIYPKLTAPNTNGTGLKNLENRFMLLMNNKIKILNDGKTFMVCLPLIKNKNEGTDC